MEKLAAAATADRFQLTTDGFNAYPDAVEFNYGSQGLSDNGPCPFA
jgi:hypothetical protein